MLSRRASTDSALVSSASLVRSVPIVLASPGSGTAAAARSGSCGMNHVNRNAASETPAAVRNTEPNAPVNAFRYAARTAGGSACNCATLGSFCPLIWAATVAGRSWTRLAASRLLKMAPNTATPTVPPMDRKNVAPEVAAPRSR
jgi:hypothetical protein